MLAFFISIFECISIHAPREGSDSVRALNLYSALCISIHAPREGSDHRGQVAHVASRRFLSTLPVRGATGFGCGTMIGNIISIHAPREGSDSPTRPASSVNVIFLSTLPVRGATRQRLLRVGRPVISIHAPREGSDAAIMRLGIVTAKYFYPRSP